MKNRFQGWMLLIFISILIVAATSVLALAEDLTVHRGVKLIHRETLPAGGASP